MAFGSFSSLFIALCASSDVAVYLTSDLVGFSSYPRWHSFASLIDKQLSRKATLMFQDVFNVRTFPTNIPNPLLFLSKSAQKFSRQNLLVRKKVAGRAIRFFPDLSATNQRAP